MASSDLAALSESCRGLVAELQRFLDDAEPVTGGRPLPTAAWYAELQDACNQAHYLWTRLETIRQQLREAGGVEPE